MEPTVRLVQTRLSKMNRLVEQTLVPKLRQRLDLLSTAELDALLVLAEWRDHSGVLELLALRGVLGK